MRLVFAGTPAAALPSLRTLLEVDRHEVAAVVTRPAKPQGRGRALTPSPVAELAAEHGVPVLTPAKAGDPEFLDQLRDLEPDCCPVVAYGALLPSATLEIPVHGWVNLHFSILPAWRGAAPVQHAVLHGDDVTGASTFLIERGLDTGPVFGVLTETVRPTDTAGDLLDRLATAGAGLLLATLDGIEGGQLEPVPQPDDGVSIAGKITVDDARIVWTDPAVAVDRRVRACTPEPGAWTTFRDTRLRLGPVGLTGDPESLTPGEIAVVGKAVRIGTATRAVELGWVQPPGKKPMPAADWARGARPTPGERCA
ncbi:methionyl-tRNA formyltransferase [Jatrophihabitans sp. YIM 134969]